VLFIAGAANSIAIELATVGVDDVNVTAELAVAFVNEATGAVVDAPEIS